MPSEWFGQHIGFFGGCGLVGIVTYGRPFEELAVPIIKRGLRTRNLYTTPGKVSARSCREPESESESDRFPASSRVLTVPKLSPSNELCGAASYCQRLGVYPRAPRLPGIAGEGLVREPRMSASRPSEQGGL